MANTAGPVARSKSSRSLALSAADPPGKPDDATISGAILLSINFDEISVCTL